MTKHIYTLITPEGKEFVIGAYDTEKRASAAAKRKFPADYLSLCSYPFKQRELNLNEKVKSWSRWNGNNS